MSDLRIPTLFGPYFNLHPLDAFSHVHQLTSTLHDFIDGFKQRIQLQIDYSRSLLRISKTLEKYINPNEPTPISYIASAFKVEHEEKARHSLELAGYLHTEIEVPCEGLLLGHQNELKRVERELRRFEREGETVQQTYQKHLKKYYKSRQEWEEKMIIKDVLNYTPGVTVGQREKAMAKLEEQRRECEEHRGRYIQSLQGFNAFAVRYNKAIDPLILSLEDIAVQEVSQQMDSMRKLIVSEINMFKNVEYDLLNISRQMEQLTPGNQIECFVVNSKDAFESPIISIYAEGPVVPYRYEIVDLKSPLGRSMMEETLTRIERGVFPSLLQNKNSEVLRECVGKLMRGKEEEQLKYQMEIFQEEVRSNISLRFVPSEGDKMQGEVFGNCVRIVEGIGEMLQRNGEMADGRMKEVYQLLEAAQSEHHFYRFLSFLALDEYRIICSQRIEDELTAKHYLILIRVLLDKCLRTRDIFVCRAVLSLLFSVTFAAQGQQRYLYQAESISQLQLWESRDFWEATIFEATYELIALLPSGEREYLKEVYLLRQKNIIFSGLITYCHYMVMLGCEVQFVKSTMGRFAEIYRLLDEHERDLNKTILHSYEQFCKGV